MALKLLDDNGLLYVWQKIKTLIGNIPSPNDGTLTIQKEGASIGTFTANQSGNSTVNITESDPVFAASPAHGIESNDITAWNNKYDKPANGIPPTDLSSDVQETLSNTSQITGVDNTITSGTSSTNVPTSAAVETRIADAIASAQVGAATFKGTANTGTDISGLTTYKAGWYWLVATAGTYVGQVCEVGDHIYCVADFSSSYKDSDFSVVQANVTSITNAEIDTICV